MNKNPDRVLLRYAELSESLGTTKAMDPRAIEGLEKAVRCQHCHHRHYHEVRGKYGYVFRCKRCSKPWRVKPAWVPKGVIQLSGRRHEPYTDMLAELATLGSVLSCLTLWEERAWSLYLLQNLSYAQVAEAARRRWPRAPFAWSAWRAQRLVQGARRAVGRRLDLAADDEDRMAALP